MPETTTTPAADQESTAKATTDYLQDALADLDKAREQAGEEVSANIDSARKRISEAREELSDRGQDQVKDWREQFGSVADDALQELGRWAIRAQRTPEALSELSKEISKREAEIGA
jgi:uncharacterized protein YicC (UPF0701 family)